MGNTRKPTATPGKNKGLAAYRAEVKGDPFVLPIDDEVTLTIPRPSGDQMLEAEEATNSREIIRALCGDLSEEFLAIVGKEDSTVMSSIAADMQEHFGLGE